MQFGSSTAYNSNATDGPMVWRFVALHLDVIGGGPNFLRFCKYLLNHNPANI